MAETEQTSQGITTSDVQSIVDGAFDAFALSQQRRDETLEQRLSAIEGSFSDLSSLVEASGDTEGVVYEVRATSSQVETAKSALRLLCTECLVLIVVMSICAGLLAWRAFTARWFTS